MSCRLCLERKKETKAGIRNSAGKPIAQSFERGTTATGLLKANWCALIVQTFLFRIPHQGKHMWADVQVTRRAGNQVGKNSFPRYLLWPKFRVICLSPFWERGHLSLWSRVGGCLLALCFRCLWMPLRVAEKSRKPNLGPSRSKSSVCSLWVAQLS